MKRLLILAVLALAVNTVTLAQQLNQALPLVPLSEQQQAKLAAVPEVRAPLSRGPLVLPYAVDNSTLPYFRPLFTQSGLECGQASSIGLGLTYEIDLKRGVPANLPQNQFATYFTYNFINGGSDAGVSFLESWEVVKRVGNPTVYDYGGLSAGGPSRWMTGYDLYYNAMHNRITDVGLMYLNTVEGLNTLRSWIYNHMGQASIGGVAHFYSQYGSVNIQLPAGTPEAGRYVITSWGSSPNHSMTILGYNDSIRYDYNGDGQYTNNIDINGDGIIDIKDWEIGGFKIANTYGNVTNWADQGFAWAMYKSFAENPSNGGIWNNAAYIAYAKQDLAPKLTMKISLKHTSRNKIKVTAGVAKNLAATEPEVILNLPIFDYQGGDKYMRGGTTEADKTIEFGLDATPLLSEIISGQPAKFFLVVQENDPSNAATGQIVSFDLINYTNGIVTIPGGSTNVPLVENGITTLAITATINCNQPAITNTSLPDAKIYEPYSQQMNVTGGNSPYKWRMMNDYAETPETAPFPSVNAQQLAVNNYSSGYATMELPFAFPYYGKAYTKIYPHVDGYLMFEDHPVPWPYIIYERTFFKNTRCISPYMGKPLTIESGDNDGIWYQGNQDSASFRWKVSVYGIASTEANFAVTLYPDGRINFYYGNTTSAGTINWIAGLSNGDGLNYHLAAITDSLVQPTANSKFLFTTQPFPTEMSISDNGLFSGTPLKAYVNVPLRFYVEDNNFLYSTKTLNFNTKGVEISYQVSSGNDSIIEYGETVHLTPTLKNISNTTLHNVVMYLDINDPFTTLNDSIETIGILNPGQIATFPDAFSFSVSNNVPNNHPLNLASQVVATEDIFNRTIQLPAWSADISITNVAISDGNDNTLMPGETGNLLVTLHNSGGSSATNLDAALSTIDPYLTILQGSAILDTLDATSSQVLTYTVQANSSCPNGHIGFMTFALSGDKDITLNDSVFINIGPIIEDFETGNFTRFPWQFAGNSNWNITLSQPYQGTYSAASGTLLDNQECSMYLTLDVLTASDISFYRKVSSEANYDYLYFYIDGQEQGKWSGQVPWSKVSFQVQAGTHSFRWKYMKDYSVSTGSDKAWVDYISWPPIANMLLIAYAGPDDIACSGQGYQLEGQVMNAASVWWTSSGDGTLVNNYSPNAIYYPGTNDLNNGIVTLTIHASQNAVPSVTDNMMLSIFPGPQANAGPNLSVCPGNSIQILQSFAANQTSVLWTTSGDGSFDDPSLLTPVYTPGSNDLLIGTATLTLTATGNADCPPMSDILLLTINPAVITVAGNDQTISYNTSTQLAGSASGGSGAFSASWEPSDLLINPAVFNPLTTNLIATQLFTLTATNNITGCFSSDEVCVIVSGGPLSVTATATPTIICAGETSQLSAIGGGGSGIYTYLWSSNPAGFNSTLQYPLVSPAETTVYTVEMNDGSASVFAQVTVTVKTLPATPAKPMGPLAVNVMITATSTYTTTGSPNTSQYFWNFSPASAGTLIPNGTTCQVQWNSTFNGIASLCVTAMNSCGSSAASDTLFIIANTEVGFAEGFSCGTIRIYPNPGDGVFFVVLDNPGDYTFRVFNQLGKLRKETTENIVEHELNYRLDLNDFPSGVYYISISNEGKWVSQKLTIIK